MSYAERHTVTVTTATGGGATAFTSAVVTGRVAAVRYTAATAADAFASTADFTITTEQTGQNLWVDSNIAASEVVYPVIAANLAGTGAASTLTEAPVIAAAERLKVVVAQGGNTKQGTFTFVVA